MSYNIEVFNFLIKHGANVNRPELLHVAIYINNLEMVDKLLSLGVHANATSMYGKTPLHQAIFCNRPKIINKLLSLGADVNVKNNHGITPIHNVVKINHIEKVKLLLSFVMRSSI